jgi:hypothetical protein
MDTRTSSTYSPPNANDVLKQVLNLPENQSRTDRKRLIKSSSFERHINSPHHNIASMERAQHRLRMKLKAKKEQQQSKDN